jgi:hypothetical protein
MFFKKRQERSALQAKCRKGKPCGAICIPKGSSCKEGKRTKDNEVTRHNQEYVAALFTQSVDPWTGQPDFQRFRSLPRSEQQKSLKAAYRWLEGAETVKKDSCIAGSAAHQLGGKPDSLIKSIKAMKEKKIRQDQQGQSLKDRIGGVADRILGKSKFVKGAGKCGPGWKPGPGGKCIRTKRVIAKRVALGAGALAAGVAGGIEYQKHSGRMSTRKAKAERIAQKIEQRAYDKSFDDRMSKDFSPKVANFQGRKSAMEARKKFERRAKVKKDSLMDYQEIAGIIAQSQGFRVDSIHEVEDFGDTIAGFGSSGGEFFQFEINANSTGILPRPDLTAAVNERSRGILAASGISYRGDSAYDFLRGMESREDNIGAMAGKAKTAVAGAINRAKTAVAGGVDRVKSAMGTKSSAPSAPAPGKKRKALKMIGKVAAAGALAGGAVAGYKNRDKIKQGAAGVSSAVQSGVRDAKQAVSKMRQPSPSPQPAQPKPRPGKIKMKSNPQAAAGRKASNKMGASQGGAGGFDF